MVLLKSLVPNASLCRAILMPVALLACTPPPPPPQAAVQAVAQPSVQKPKPHRARLATTARPAPPDAATKPETPRCSTAALTGLSDARQMQLFQAFNALRPTDEGSMSDAHNAHAVKDDADPPVSCAPPD